MLSSLAKVGWIRTALLSGFVLITVKLGLGINSGAVSMPHAIFATSSSAAASALLPDTFLDAGPELDAFCARYRQPPYEDRTRRRKIYSLTMINTELDMLALRMGEMAAAVDYFVIVESPVTFSDLEKPLYVQDNYHRFKPWHDRMILHTLNATAMPGVDDIWGREAFSRNAVFDQVFSQLRGEQKAWPGDVIIVGDADEIVRPEVLHALRNCDFPKRTRLHTKLYYYSFQWISPGKGEGNWDKPDATYFDGFKNTILPQSLREEPTEHHVWNAGWHCSYCFGLLSDIIMKVKSYSHKENDRPEFLDPATIVRRIRNGEDLFTRGGEDCHRVDNNLDVPEYLLQNPKEFGYMLDRDPEDANFQDYEDFIVGSEEEQGW